MKIVLVLATASLLLGGCVGNPIKNYDNLAQSSATELNTHIGGQVFKIDRSTDLPNAFGKADIFGGKVNRGYTELRYQGTRDNKLIFRLTEVETYSNETTMSRYGGDTTYVDSSSRLRGNRIQTTGTITTVPGAQGSTEALPPNTTEFLFDPTKKKEITISGVRVIIIDHDEHSLRYMLSQ